MTELDKILATITPEIYTKLQNAVATGKWPNSVPLTTQQRENSLQLIIAYDQLHKIESERVGFVKPKSNDCSHLQPSVKTVGAEGVESISTIKIL